MATGRINLHEMSKTVFKEMRVGLILGAIYGLCLGVVAFVAYPDPFNLAFVVGISIFFTMVLAATVGTFVPLTFRRLGVDAAIATGPFVTTTIDILGIIAYFTIAKILLSL
jgi:magnesium transporter